MATQTFDLSDLYSENSVDTEIRVPKHAKYDFATAQPDPTSIPLKGLTDALSSMLERQGTDLAYYPDARGIPELRELIAAKLERDDGFKTSPDNIAVVNGSAEANFLVIKALINPGDTVIMEIFTYQGAVNRLRSLKVNVIGIPLDEGGMRMDALASSLADLRQQGVTPKYIYTIPTLQNPTGTVMGLERRHEMLRLSQEYGVPIFEDECYADLIWEGEWPPAIYALDTSNHVIHIGSFSKSLSPSLRLGYVVAPWEILSRMLACKSDGGTGALEQMIVADFFQNHYQEHMDTLRASMKRKLEVLIAALEANFGSTITFNPPPGGMFLWIKFPDGVDTKKVEGPALQQGIAFNAGPDWAADPEAARNYLRLCYALPSEQQIEEGVAKLAQVFRQELGIPA